MEQTNKSFAAKLAASAVFLVISLAAGLFFGCGNHGGTMGALIVGVIVGGTLACAALRPVVWTSVGLAMTGAIVGSLIATSVPDSNSLKRACRNQTLVIAHVTDAYHLGRD
jgi:hypothetical protein